MINKLKYIFCLLLVINCGICSAQDSLSLQQAIQTSLGNNYEIVISKLETRIAQNNNTWGQAGRYPTITLNMAQTNSIGNINTPGSFLVGGIQRDNLIGNIDAGWVLFDGYKVNINKRRLEKLESLSSGYSAIVVEGTVQAVILSYYQALLEKEKLTAFEKVMTLSRERYELALLKKNVGTGNQFDVLTAKTAFFNDSSNYMLSGVNYNNSLRNLNLLLATEVDKDFILSDKLEFTGNDYQRDTLALKMFRNNLTLKNQYINYELQKNNLQYQRSNLYPRVTLNTGANGALNYLDREGQQSRTGNSYDFYANFTLSYTLFNGGRIRNNIENAGIAVTMDSVGIKQQKLAMNNQLVSLLELYDLRRKVLHVVDENIVAANAELELAEVQYKNGNISTFEYRQVQLSYLTVAIRRYELLYDLVDVHTALMRITGGILDMQ